MRSVVKHDGKDHRKFLVERPRTLASNASGETGAEKSHTPPTQRDYERAIKAIAESRSQVQRLIDATQRDEHYTLGQLGPILSDLKDAEAALQQLRNYA
jgi:hypothetical protein